MTCHLLMKMTILQKCTHYCNSGIVTPICFLKGRFHLTQHDQKLFHRNHYIYKQTKTTTDLWHNKTANNFRHIINIYLKLTFVTVAILSLVFTESKNNLEKPSCDLRVVEELSRKMHRTWRSQSKWYAFFNIKSSYWWRLLSRLTYQN